MQAAVITASMALFPTMTQLFEFPTVFGDPMATEGIAQQIQAKVKRHRPNLHMDTMNKRELEHLN